MSRFAERRFRPGGRRFPRTWSCPMAVVIVKVVPMSPRQRTRNRLSAPTLFAWSTACVRKSPAGPGAALRIASTTTLRIPRPPNAAANPTMTIRPCTSTSDVTKARERAWLVPSASRSRMNAPLRRRMRPVVASVFRASSPVSSHVSGTPPRCSRQLQATIAEGDRHGCRGTRTVIASGSMLTFRVFVASRAPPSSS